MSQTVKTLKKIATGEEYKALEAGIKDLNPEAIAGAYLKISAIVEESEKTVLDQIQKLNRQNKDLDWQKFRAAFSSRSKSILPQWDWINEQLRKQKVMEGKVIGKGTRGDPLVRSPEGRIVVIRDGANLKEGDNVRFRVTSESQKIDFGIIFELNPQNFYFILTQDTRDKVMNALKSASDAIEAMRATDGGTPPDLDQSLKDLAAVSELAGKLRAEEEDRIIARVQSYRKRLFGSYTVRLVFDFLAAREEKEIAETSGDKKEMALSAPGLFCFYAHNALKAELLAGEKPRGYADIIGKMQENIDSMATALNVLDFEAKVDEVYPGAKKYLEKIDKLYDRISGKAVEMSFQLGESNVSDAQQVQAAIQEAFSAENMAVELRRAFRSPGEFFELRSKLEQLRERLGNTQIRNEEAAIEPYLRKTVNAAFSGTRFVSTTQVHSS